MAMTQADLDKLNTEIDSLLKLVPEDQREAARAHYSRVQDGVNQITATAREQGAWWERNKDAVVERDSLRVRVAQTNGNTNPNPNPNPENPTGNVITEAMLKKALEDQRADLLGIGLGMTTEIPSIGLKHMKEFGEELDLRKLAKDAMDAGKNVQDYYNESVAPRRLERDTAARTAELAAAEQRGIEKGRKEILERTPGQGMPYPVGSSAPTTLAGLKKPEGANPYGLDAAVATANSVLARQSPGT